MTVWAQPHTDIFIDPGDGAARAGAALNAESMLNAATLTGDVPEGDFQFSARVTAGFAATFDAGVLLLWLDERRMQRDLRRDPVPARAPRRSPPRLLMVAMVTGPRGPASSAIAG